VVTQYDQLVRLKEFELDERRRDAGEILSEVNRLNEQKRRLEEDLKEEQKLASGSVDALRDYGMYASRIIQKRETLEIAIADIEKAYTAANRLVSAAYQEVRKAEIVRDEAAEKEKQKLLRREQLEMDEIAQNIYRRNKKNS
tara:strand:+ start:633 stop:1058 length:426 start_codon:yes stop_codon:yes gene_type:complete